MAKLCNEIKEERMKLNPNSWHARWYVWLGADLPCDLCSYMWGLLFRTIGRFSVAAFLFLCLAVTIATIILYPYVDVIIIGIVSGIFLLRWFIKGKPKFLSLIRDFLKAKKEKYCPMIEWENK